MKRLWIAFVLVLFVSFVILGWIGSRIYQEAPPIADEVVTTDGATVIGSGEIQAGQNVWQSLGGMEVGSIWGHGSYVAPDWTADWLHREAVFILDRWAQDEFGGDFAVARRRAASAAERPARDADAHQHLRSGNRDDHDRSASRCRLRRRIWPTTRTSSRSGEARLRDSRRRGDRRQRGCDALSAFFFWTSWAASTNRPDSARSATPTTGRTSRWSATARPATRSSGRA